MRKEALKVGGTSHIFDTDLDEWFMLLLLQGLTSLVYMRFFLY
jgi:hypothetical protein